MAKIPNSILKLLTDLPESSIEFICRETGISKSRNFIEFAQKRSCSKSIHKDYLVDTLTSGFNPQLNAIYKKLEFYLLVGGCAPGIGIAFNIIDACFCVALGNYFGSFIAIVSCFPIPGFKVAGKGLEKIIAELLQKISPTEIINFSKAINKRLSNYYWDNFNKLDSSNLIREELGRLIAEMNTFAIPSAGTLIEKLDIRTAYKNLTNITDFNAKTLKDKTGTFLQLTKRTID